MGYEFVAIQRDTRERAVVQVKTGNAALDLGGWGGFQERVFLFQANGVYFGQASAHVTPLSPSVIEDFMRTNDDVMPAAVQRWLHYTNPRSGSEPV